MKRVELKLEARRRLAGNHTHAKTAVLIYLLFRLCFAALSVFFVLAIIRLPVLTADEPLGIPSAVYGVYFSVCIIILTAFSAVFRFLLRRSFFAFANGESRLRFFKILPLRFQLKIIYLRFLCFSHRFSSLLFYLFPFAVSLVYLRFRLTNGMDKRLFALCCALSLILLLLGIYYLFLSMQKTAFADEELLIFPECSAHEIYESVCAADREYCLETAKLKLSFLAWYCLCALVFPVLFVMPYYLMTSALYKKSGP